MDKKEYSEIIRTVESREITLSCRFIGNDLHLFCYGGDKAHIGAASLAIPYRNKSGMLSASVSTLTAPEHRDDAISRALAERFAKALGCVTIVVCGIHYENASPALIQLIQETVSDMAGELQEYYSAAVGNSPS